ncbi:hypothetical protein [Vibrio rotiferianus]|uniref:hypothetical protein n=1 Tax=Vibrio rotiferianus TaxID=190895 RepID=UPI002893FDF3|nr:exported hypothetical protein [Vibrio rotiferianus]
MLKKTLVALAIASVAGAATAATIDAPSQVAKISNQGAAKLDYLEVVGQNVLVTAEAEYKIDDLLKFDVNNASLLKLSDLNIDTTVELASYVVDSTNNTYHLVSFDDQGAKVYTPALASDATISAEARVGTMTLGLLATSTTEQLVFRVTDLSFEADLPASVKTTLGGKIEVTGLQFNTASVLGSAKSFIDFTAETQSGIPLDAAEQVQIFEPKNQFAATIEDIDKFDAVIDVNTHRLTFEQNAVTDHATISTTDDAANLKYAAFPKETVYVINGDFSFLGEADDNGVIDAKVTSSIASGDKLVVTADKITATFAGITANTITIDVSDDDGLAAAKALATQQFTADVTTTYYHSKVDETQATTTDSVTLLNGADAGQWTLNGAVVHVPFMPFRSGYSPIVNVSNTSNQDGDIEVLVYAENDASWVEPVSYMLPVTAKAESQTNITAALQGAGISGDVAFDIIVNAPKDDIEVNALFYRDGDRAVINTVKQN